MSNIIKVQREQMIQGIIIGLRNSVKRFGMSYTRQSTSKLMTTLEQAGDSYLIEAYKEAWALCGWGQL
jgi:hypothetical protein